MFGTPATARLKPMRLTSYLDARTLAAGALCLAACSNGSETHRGSSEAGTGGVEAATLGNAAEGSTEGDVGSLDAGSDASPCPVSCHGTCMEGRCLVTLAETSWPTDIAVDGTSVYFTSCPDGGGGFALSVPLDGGSSMALASGQGCPVSLALGDTSLFLAGIESGTIMKVPRGGGTLTALASGADAPIGVASDGANVIWTTMGGNVMKVPIVGGFPTALSSGQKGLTRPVVDAAFAYWGAPNAGTIQKVPLDGGPPTTVTSGLETVTALAIARTDVYFADGYSLAKAPLGGGPATGVGLPTGAPVGAVAVDDANVYFTSWGSIWKIAFAGDQPTRIATDQGEPNAIAVDATSVYWTNAVDGPSGACCGHVLKLTPK
jgi:hypothetical protein